jgi:hypothetical protein
VVTTTELIATTPLPENTLVLLTIPMTQLRTTAPQQGIELILE